MWWPFCNKEDPGDSNSGNNGNSKSSDSIDILIQERGRVIDNQVDVLQNQRNVASHIFRASILLFSLIVTAAGFIIERQISGSGDSNGANATDAANASNEVVDSGTSLINFVIEILPVDIALATIAILLYVFIYLLLFSTNAVRCSLSVLGNLPISEELLTDKRQDFNTTKSSRIHSEERDLENIAEHQKEVINDLSKKIANNERYISGISDSGRRVTISLSIPVFLITLFFLGREFQILSPSLSASLIVLTAMFGPLAVFILHFFCSSWAIKKLQSINAWPR